MIKVKNLAIDFKYVNTKLMIVSQQSPVETLLHKIFNTVDNKLETIKSDLISSHELESNLLNAELNQLKIEEKMKQLKQLNSYIC
jgi:hypothetical protein